MVPGSSLGRGARLTITQTRLSMGRVALFDGESWKSLRQRHLGLHRDAIATASESGLVLAKSRSPRQSLEKGSRALRKRSRDPDFPTGRARVKVWGAGCGISEMAKRGCRKRRHFIGRPAYRRRRADLCWLAGSSHYSNYRQGADGTGSDDARRLAASRGHGTHCTFTGFLNRRSEKLGGSDRWRTSEQKTPECRDR
jgi:hypothetical protein